MKDAYSIFESDEIFNIDEMSEEEIRNRDEEYTEKEIIIKKIITLRDAVLKNGVKKNLTSDEKLKLLRDLSDINSYKKHQTANCYTKDLLKEIEKAIVI